MKFDWYQASILGEHPEVVMGVLASADYYGQWEESRPLKGYDVGAQFVVGDQVLYRLNHGGQNAAYGANVVGSGGYAEKLAKVIRDRFPSHKVSRIDSCEDYHHPDVYNYLRKKALKIAEQQKVQVREIVKPLPGSDDGRTLYLGSKTSSISMRIYEKGKQLGCGEDWVRAELQVRPQKQVKEIAAHLSAVDVWGLAKWSHAMAQVMGNTELQRVDAQVYQQSDHERAYRFLLKQYGKTLLRMLSDHGSPEAVGSQIFHDLEELAIPPAKATLKAI